MGSVFHGFDVSKFWGNRESALNEYVSLPPTEELIRSIEHELGYQLPASYIEFMTFQNGGIPQKCAFPTTEPTSWSEDHIMISEILGIGREKPYSLCGKFGSRFIIEEWGYPDIGVYFAACPSGGHDMVCLDYRTAGKDGEPQVVYVSQGNQYRITFLSQSFEAFIKGLVDKRMFDGIGDVYICPDCGGEAVEQECPDCEGQEGNDACMECHGSGFVTGYFECLECGCIYHETEVRE